MRKALLLLSATIAVAMGCDSRKPLSVVENCLMKREDGWLQIEPPPERTDFLAMRALNADGTYMLVGEQFAAAVSEREAWLKSADDRLLGCVYTPTRHDVCEDGMPRAFEFKRSKDGWNVAKLNPFCLQ